MTTIIAALQLAIALLTAVAGNLNGGDKADDDERFINKRAEMFWRAREWILKGGKLKREDHWYQMSKMKYKTILEGRKGKIQMMSKEAMLRNGIGVARCRRCVLLHVRTRRHYHGAWRISGTARGGVYPL